MRSPHLGPLCEKVQDLAGGKEGLRPRQELAVGAPTPEQLAAGHYRVSWQCAPPAARYLLLIAREGVFAFGAGPGLWREGSCFHLPGLHFPRRKNLQERVDKTVVEAELVHDQENGRSVARFLLSDILSFEGHPLWKAEPSLDRRLQCIDAELIRPRKVAANLRSPNPRFPHLPWDLAGRPRQESLRDRLHARACQGPLEAAFPRGPPRGGAREDAPTTHPQGEWHRAHPREGRVSRHFACVPVATCWQHSGPSGPHSPPGGEPFREVSHMEPSKLAEACKLLTPWRILRRTRAQQVCIWGTEPTSARNLVTCGPKRGQVRAHSRARRAVPLPRTKGHTKGGTAPAGARHPLPAPPPPTGRAAAANR